LGQRSIFCSAKPQSAEFKPIANRTTTLRIIKKYLPFLIRANKKIIMNSETHSINSGQAKICQNCPVKSRESASPVQTSLYGASRFYEPRKNLAKILRGEDPAKRDKKPLMTRLGDSLFLLLRLYHNCDIIVVNTANTK